MPDREQSTRTFARCLRESFIAFYQRDGQEAALRLLDELAYQFTCEMRGSYLMGKDEHALDRSEILGAAGDFRQAADQLRESAQGMAETANEDREVMRVTLALADTSAAVQPLADALDAAVARYLAAPSGE
jgi:hypothetical protein